MSKPKIDELEWLRDLLRWMEAGQRLRAKAEEAGFTLPHALKAIPAIPAPDADAARVSEEGS